MRMTGRSHLPSMTRRRFVATAGLAALAALVIGAAKKADPVVAAAAPVLRPDAAGTSAGRCAHCGSATHATLSPACDVGAVPRRALQSEAWRRAAGRAAHEDHPPPVPRGRRACRREGGRGRRARSANDRRLGRQGRGAPLPAGRPGGAHHLLPELHRVLRAAGLRARRQRGQGPAGGRLPGERVQPARLHEGHLLPPADPRPRPHPDAARADRASAGSGEFREATLGRGPRAHRRRSSSASATSGAGTSVHVFSQVPGSGYIQKGAAYRACAALGMTHGTSFDFNGDLPMGMPITFGVQNAEHESKDWANSRFILLIGANPLETRIPDVHFIHDAVEKGARLVVVDPTFSSTAAKADAWLQIKPGTDAALGLALCRQVVGGRQGRLGLHAHVHGRAAAGAHATPASAARGRAGRAARPATRARPRASASASTAARRRRSGTAPDAAHSEPAGARPAAARRTTATSPGTPRGASRWSSAPTGSASPRACEAALDGDVHA